MIRIPYPIPLPARAQLIAAGKEACKQPDGSLSKLEAHSKVEEIIDQIEKRYGKECHED